MLAFVLIFTHGRRCSFANENVNVTTNANRYAAAREISSYACHFNSKNALRPTCSKSTPKEKKHKARYALGLASWISETNCNGKHMSWTRMLKQVGIATHAGSLTFPGHPISSVAPSICDCAGEGASRALARASRPMLRR